MKLRLGKNETYWRFLSHIGMGMVVVFFLFLAFRNPQNIGEGTNVEPRFGTAEDADGEGLAEIETETVEASPAGSTNTAVVQDEDGEDGEDELREDGETTLALEGVTLIVWEKEAESQETEAVGQIPRPIAGRRREISETEIAGDGKPLGTGDISFRLHWKPPMHDIDLHVIDPNGHEICYRSSKCRCSGNLDRDDQVGGGPENIFWPHGKSPKGQFKYFAFYYQGTGPKKVLIETRVHGQIVHRDVFTLHSSGNRSQTFFFDHK